MKKYFALLSYEFKNLFKDKMNAFMIVYPFLMLFITGFLMPKITEMSNDAQTSMIVLVISFMFSLLLGSFVGGVLLGFSLLDSKDERTLNTVAVTPASIKGYILFKSIYCTVLSFLSNIIIIYGLKLLARDAYTIPIMNINLLDRINAYHIFTFSIVNSLITPAMALIIATIAKNKVEGFMFVKGGGMILMLPLLMMLEAFSGAKQYILGIMPNFWSVKAIYNVVMGSTSQYDISFLLYMIIGSVMSILFSILFYRLFNKKIQILT